MRNALALTAALLLVVATSIEAHAELWCGRGPGTPLEHPCSDEDTVADPAVAAASAALRLAEQASSVGELAPLEQAVAANPDDHKARFDLAVALSAKGDRAGAADQLLEIIRRDRKWNDEAARKQLLQLFEAWGLMDPESIAARRKLSAIWF